MSKSEQKNHFQILFRPCESELSLEEFNFAVKKSSCDHRVKVTCRQNLNNIDFKSIWTIKYFAQIILVIYLPIRSRSSHQRCSVKKVNFPVNLTKFLRIPFLQNTSGWLLPIRSKQLSNFQCLSEIFEDAQMIVIYLK